MADERLSNGRLVVKNLREYTERISPAPLTGFWGSRLMVGLFGFFSDLGAEALEQAITIGWVKRALLPTDALAAIGSNANIERVSGESTAAYRLRLIDKWELWEESATGTFAENALAPFGVSAASVTVNTIRDWTPDLTGNWSRFWIILEGADLPWSELEWGAFTWGTPELTWGTSASQEEIFGLIRLLCKWKSGHEVGVEVILLFDGFIWGGPGKTWGSFTWGSDGVVRWPLGRFWGSFIWGEPEPYRPQFGRVWGGKIKV